jgi:hypothetical protein
MFSNKLFPFLGLLLLAALPFFTACEDDEEVTPEATTISGTISIENADIWETWVDSGEVQVTLFPEFSLDPPAGWGEIPDNFFGPGVPGGTYALGAPYNSQNPLILEYEAGKTEYAYELEVEPGTYSALAVGFRHDFVTDPSLRTATVGVHWDNETEVSHGIVIRVDMGNGMIIPVYNYPAPSNIEVREGEQKVINFRVDFDFLNEWY